jgi:tRNA-2-methylthio-N6-dimethylallyladenosine synthase
VDGVRRIRFTSPHPNDFSERVVAAMAEVPQVCEHVHLPMQSGSTRVLKRMLRRYTADGYRECVARLRAAIPGLNLTTDIIVGFPGETRRTSRRRSPSCASSASRTRTRSSSRPATARPATRMDPDSFVPADVAGRRLERLIAAVRAGARERNLRLLGTRHEVLVEKAARRGEMLQARTRDYKTVLLPADGVVVGGYYTVELTGTTGSTFTGAVVRDAARRGLPLPMAAAGAG